MWDKEKEIQIGIRNGLISQKQVIERYLSSLGNNYTKQNRCDETCKTLLP